MKRIFFVPLCLLLIGCASFYVEKVDKDKVYAPTDPAAVKIFTQAPSQPYVIIAEIRAQGGTFSMQDNMEQRLKEKAAELGADAVILKVDKEVRGIRKNGVLIENTYGYDVNSMVTKKMSGKVIRFTK